MTSWKRNEIRLSQFLPPHRNYFGRSIFFWNIGRRRESQKSGFPLPIDKISFLTNQIFELSGGNDNHKSLASFPPSALTHTHSNFYSASNSRIHLLNKLVLNLTHWKRNEKNFWVHFLPPHRKDFILEGQVFFDISEGNENHKSFFPLPSQLRYRGRPIFF